MIVFGKPEGGSVSQSLIIFYVTPSDSLSLAGAFHCSLRRCYMCLFEIVICACWMDKVAHRVYITSKEITPLDPEFKYHYAMDLL